MDSKTLKKILDEHHAWLKDRQIGKRAKLSYADLLDADLSGADLRGADLSCADLRGANLSGADLGCAKLSCADLSDAKLINADLRSAKLSCADLTDADLTDADLSGANLINANLRGANFSGVKVDCNTTGYFSVCPDVGSFIAFKKAHNLIVVLDIPSDAQRSSATSLKCRCDKATVLRIENLDGSISDLTSVNSDYDENFIYNVGKTVQVDNFDTNRWNECSSGIHFFLSRDLAVLY